MIVSSRPKTTRSFQYVAMVLYMLFLAFPLLWMLSISFKGPRELVELHPHLIPSDPTLPELPRRVHPERAPARAWNSFKVSTLTALLTTLVALPAAYVLARQRGADLEGGPRLDPGQPDVPADPDHHPALPRAEQRAPDRLALRPRVRLHGLDAAVRALDAAELRPRHPARSRGGGDGRRREPPPGRCEP